MIQFKLDNATVAVGTGETKIASNKLKIIQLSALSSGEYAFHSFRSTA